jgi:hypothetical protein
MSKRTSGFNPEVLDDPGFKEDSVREEVTFPLLVRLGYASSGDSKIIRSKSLSNPFVMIGTTKRPVTQIFVRPAPSLAAHWRISANE